MRRVRDAAGARRGRHRGKGRIDVAGRGSLEQAVLGALWDAGRPLLVRELRDRVNLEIDRPLAYTTVQTVADRLARKGYSPGSRRGARTGTRPPEAARTTWSRSCWRCSGRHRTGVSS
ncbi:MAG: hypothetical protein GEV03_00720 [Streptosporangiales bacterium]|nr:hypothetical protein [Streptosporangiales bacterium]